MTKNDPKKASKTPRRRTDNYEVIRHFDPFQNITARRTNLQVDIPQVNVYSNNDASKPKSITRRTPKPIGVFTPIPTKAGTLSTHILERKKKLYPKFRSSSSSSVDVGFEKFTNKAKVKSKSFHFGQTKQSNEKTKRSKSPTEKALAHRIKSEKFKSVTDPALIRKELILKSLKEEILDNKRITAIESPRPTSTSSYSYLRNSPQVQKIKDEINRTKSKDLMNKKIFITELNTEIAQYKRFNSYQVYTHNGSSLNNHEVSQTSRSSLPKSLKKMSLKEDSLDKPRKGSSSSPRKLSRTFSILKPILGSGSSNAVSKSPQRSFLGESSKRRKSKEELKTPRLSSSRRNSNSVCGSSSSSPSRARGRSPTVSSTSPHQSAQSEENNGKRKNQNISDDFGSRKKSDASKQGSMRRISGSGERSQTGTDKESLVETSDYKPSDTTLEGSEIPSRSHCSYSDTDSFDDVMIRGKIEEANNLIRRVKRALDKVKHKDEKQPRAASKEMIRSSSTDIEQTVRKLKKDTDKLLTNGDDPNSESDPKRPMTKRGGRESKSKSPRSPSYQTQCKSPRSPAYQTRLVKKKESNKDENSVPCCGPPTKTFLKKDKSRQSLGSSDEFIEESVPKSIPDCGSRKNTLNMDRPLTRRNDAEDDLPDDLILDKFRNLPEEGQLVVNSSLEELQAKLQTISESTESMSTPRNKRSVDLCRVFPKDLKSSAYNTETLQHENQETQVESLLRVSVETSYESTQQVSEGVQAKCNPKIYLTTHKSDVLSHIPPQKPLREVNLEPYQITTRKADEQRCQAENLPVIEVAPWKTNFKCSRCNKYLTEENVAGVSLPSKLNKLQNLTIKVLPSISIDQKMVVMQALNFYINSRGETQNLLPKTKNIDFLVMNAASADTRISFSDEPKEIVEGESESNPSNEEDGDDDENKISTATSGEVSQSLSTPNSSRREETKTSQFFLKLRYDAVKNLVFADETADDTTRELDEEDRRRLLVYKSFHLHDNPNRHDPGGLDAKSVERVSAINVDFYKTFVNPTGKVSESDMPFREPVMAGFESKEVQCGSSIMFGQDREKRSTKSVVNADSDVTTRETESTKSLEKPDASITIKSTKSLENPDTTVGERESTKSLTKPGTSTVSKEKESTRSMDKPDTSSKQLMYKSAPFDGDPSKISQVTVLDMNSIDFGSILLPTQASEPFTASPPPMEQPLGPSKHESDSHSTPSEITVTISYSESSEGSTNSQSAKQSYRQSQEVEIQSTILDQLPSLEAQPNIRSEPTIASVPKKPSHLDLNISSGREITTTDVDRTGHPTNSVHEKVITVKDKEVILKLHEKFKTVNPNSSEPKLIVKKEDSSRRKTFEFIKELTQIAVDNEELDQSEADTFQDDEKISPRHSQNIHYHIIEANVLPQHLSLAKNGRYKDEEYLFAQKPYPQPSHPNGRHESPKRANENKDAEIQSNKLGFYPKHVPDNHSPDTTNSDTVTTNSLSEGEVRCRHAVSNGEIHVCEHRHLISTAARRNVLQRSNLTIHPSMNPPHNILSPRQILPRSNLTNSSNPVCYSKTQRNVLARNLTRVPSPNRNHPHPRNFDLLDPKLTIEKRRNYFNNWVTYYVKSQEIIGSSTSNCSQNK